jgi:hypothetical protein
MKHKPRNMGGKQKSNFFRAFRSNAVSPADTLVLVNIQPACLPFFTRDHVAYKTQYLF